MSTVVKQQICQIICYYYEVRLCLSWRKAVCDGGLGQQIVVGEPAKYQPRELQCWHKTAAVLRSQPLL